MFRVSFVLPAFASLALLGASSGLAYTGADSSEYIVEFRSFVELAPDMIAPSQIEEQIADQAHYMFGPISDTFGPRSRSEVDGILGAPRIDDQTRLFRKEPPFVFSETNSKVSRRALLTAPIIHRGEPVTRGGKRFVEYTYQGPMVLKNRPAFEPRRDGRKPQITLALPNNPKEIFQASEDLKPRKNGSNPCTDETFQSDGDFFYFWSPDRTNCLLRQPRDFMLVPATVRKLQNEKSTFPEYSKLADEKGNILITLIMGKDTPSRVRDPKKVRGRADDLNAENFRKIAARIESAHVGQVREFSKKVWSAPEVKEFFTHANLSPQPFVVDYTHFYPATPRGVAPRAKSLTIRMVFTNCDIGIANSVGMHKFFEHSIEHGAVTIYDGHSGLGGNLDLKEMRAASNNSFRFSFPKNRYQIYFFNSCTSYAYYTDMFFDQKKIPGSRDPKGSKFLDVMATGLETAFDGSEKTDMALIDAIHLWGKTGAETSYQSLAEKMEADNLFGVNGDEDNPTAPEGGIVAPPPPLAENGEAQAFSTFAEVDPANPPPPLDMPEFPDSAIEQGVVEGK